MKQSNKSLLFGIFIAGAIALCVFGWPLIAIVVKVATGIRHSNRERVQLLYQTDHRLLLAACREIMTNRTHLARDQFMRGQPDPGRSFIDPADPKIPAPIARLKPRYIIASDSNVDLELHGGFEHYGVIALSETTAPVGSNPPAGPVGLIPGLWYYDEGLNYNRGRWLQKLKNMKPPGAPEPDWR